MHKRPRLDWLADFTRHQPPLPSFSDTPLIVQVNQIQHHYPTNTIIMYGVHLDTGATCTVTVKNWSHYFYLDPTGSRFATWSERQILDACYGIAKVQRVQKSNCYGVDQPVVDMLEIHLMRPGNKAAVVDFFTMAGCTNFYEHHKVSPELRFMVDRKIRGCGLVVLTNWKPRSNAPSHRAWDLEISTADDVIGRDPSDDRLAHTHSLTYDIEVYNQTPVFPTPDRCPVIMISVILRDLFHDKGPLWRAVLHTKPLDRSKLPDNVLTIACPDEPALLRAFRDVVLAADPDILSGFNTDGFDMPFLFNRAKHLDLADFAELGCLRGRSITAREQQFSSAAHGKRTYWDFNYLGRISVDGLVIFQRNIKNLRSYTLNSLSQAILHQTKEDVHHSQIGRLYDGTDAERGRLASYCLKDSDLTWQLLDAKDFFMQYVQTARFIGIMLPLLLSRGEQIKVAARLLWFCADRGMVIPFRASEDRMEKHANLLAGLLHDDEDGQGYAGGLVMKPKVGLHTDGPCFCLDFSSLYPSIMIACNLCFSTLVSEADLARHPEWQENVHYRRYNSGHVFLTPAVREGILPRLARDGLDQRGVYKKQMSAAVRAGDKSLESIKNGQQLAVKVFCNSIYGFCGAEARGMLPCVPVAFTITDQGQIFLRQTAEYVERHHGYPVMYGDSVTGDTALTLRYRGTIQVMSIEQLWVKVAAADADSQTFEKLHAPVPDGWETWSDQGWTPILNIMRHRTDKPLSRVTTQTSSVIVTSDHSLLTREGVSITPSEVVVRETRLLHHPLIIDQVVDPGVSTNVAFSWGRYMSDKVVPASILNAPVAHRQAFFDGYITRDSFKFHTASQVGMHSLYLLANSLGLRVPSDTPVDDRVRAVESLPHTDGFVYDLTTANHHFAAGVGTLIVHNTDSIMPKAVGKSVDEAFAIMHLVAEDVNRNLFAQWPPMSIAPEKVMYPSLFLAPKRYITGYFGASPVQKQRTLMAKQPHLAAATAALLANQPDYVMFKGVEMVRRDNAKFVPDAVKQCVELLFMRQDREGAVAQIRRLIEAISEDRLPLDQYIMSKALRDDYKDAGSQVHAVLAAKIKARSPGEEPPVGSRVPFVVVANGATKLCDKGEDPLYALSHGVPIDREYYLEKQLRVPLTRILPHWGIDVSALFAIKQKKIAAVGSKTGLGAFFKVKALCWECQKHFVAGEGASKQLCATCGANEEVVERFTLEKANQYTEALEDVHKALARCMECQGVDGDPELCWAKDCSDLYRRKVAQDKAEKIKLTFY